MILTLTLLGCREATPAAPANQSAPIVSKPAPVVPGWDDDKAKEFDWGELGEERVVGRPDFSGLADKFTLPAPVATPVPGAWGFFREKVPGVKGTSEALEGMMSWMPWILGVAVVLFFLSLPGKIVGGLFGILPTIGRILFTRRRK